MCNGSNGYRTRLCAAASRPSAAAAWDLPLEPLKMTTWRSERSRLRVALPPQCAPRPAALPRPAPRVTPAARARAGCDARALAPAVARARRPRGRGRRSRAPARVRPRGGQRRFNGPASGGSRAQRVRARGRLGRCVARAAVLAARGPLRRHAAQGAGADPPRPTLGIRHWTLDPTEDPLKRSS